MKKHILLRNGFVASAVLFATFSAYTFSSQAPQNRNGSPASNGVTCANSSCHNGPGNTGQMVTITSDIPAAGFLANTEYTITVTGDWSSAMGSNTSGFEASVESNNGFEGTLSTGGASNVKTVGVGNYMSHNNEQAFSGGSTTWTFKWNSGNAPDGTSVYAAINFANGDGNRGGDVIVASSLQLMKAQNISIEEQSISDLKTYPNPASEELNISFTNGGDTYSEIALYDLQGRLAKTLFTGKISGDFNKKYSTTDLSSGIYILKIKSNEGFNHERIIVQ